MDAYVATTRRVDSGGSLLPLPTAAASLTGVKSYGTTSSDLSDANTRSTVSAVVVAANASVRGTPNTSYDFREEQRAAPAAAADGAYPTHHFVSVPPSAAAAAADLSSTPASATPSCRAGHVAVRVPPHDAYGAALTEGGGEGGSGGAAVRDLNPDPNTAAAAAPHDDQHEHSPRRLRRHPPNNAVDALLGNAPAPAFLSPVAPSPTAPAPTFVELVVRRVQSTSILQFLWVVFLMLMLVVGNAFQVIFLNFWIHQFPTKASDSSTAAGGDSSSGGEERAEALPSSYTTFVISAVVFPAVFIILFIFYAIWRRPNLGFVREGAGWQLLIGIGTMDALNSALAIYAAAHTPEVLQALFLSLVPIYSAVFTKWLLKDPRDYANPYVAVSFALIAAGVGLASLFSYVTAHHHDPSSGSGNGGIGALGGTRAYLIELFSGGAPASAAAVDKRIWCLIFFFSVPPTVLMNVWQTMYMIRYTTNDALTAYLSEHAGDAEERTTLEGASIDAEHGDGVDAESEAAGQHTRLLASTAGAATAPSPATAAAAPQHQSTRSSSVSSGATSASVRRQHLLHVRHTDLVLHGEDTSVKLVMLAADTAIQALLAFVLLPMDALPFFGGSDSISDAIKNLDEGMDCVLHCPRNLRYCLLYSTGFVLVYIAAAYLNRYSVTLCSMVSQLSGPITALLLIAFPKLNVSGDESAWYVSVFAILMLSCGTVIYVYWDEMTVEEKAVGEMQLKWSMMQQQARRHLESQPYAAVPDDASDSHGSVSARQSQSGSQHHYRHSRSRRYRRRHRSDFVVVVDPDSPDAAATLQQPQQQEGTQ